ncbi:MAG: hypothetical protein DWQ02_16075 [Bacteroidetes bacterium]|nr:MAG: hypothetical protein DWQ02_16075 [Bacteroidota bacterium]
MRKFCLFVGLFLLMSQSVMGQKIEAQIFKDQFGKAGALTTTTEYLFFSASMQASKVLKAAFEELKIDQKVLDRQNILYVSDIRAMPKAISQMIAIPKMKKYPFSVYFLEDDEKTANWPQKEDTLTILVLDNLEVRKVEYFKESDVLVEYLKEIIN